MNKLWLIPIILITLFYFDKSEAKYFTDIVEGPCYTEYKTETIDINGGIK